MNSERLEYTSFRFANEPTEEGFILYGFKPGDRVWWKPWTWGAGRWEIIGRFTRVPPSGDDTGNQ